MSVSFALGPEGKHGTGEATLADAGFCLGRLSSVPGGGHEPRYAHHPRCSGLFSLSCLPQYLFWLHDMGGFRRASVIG